MKLSVLSITAVLVSSTVAFVPYKLHSERVPFLAPKATVEDVQDVDVRTGKPSGMSFLPAETVERCKVGSPIEKMKVKKDATSAWVDIYEYARKIREGEMTWDEVEKADLDNVSNESLSRIPL
jgi:hypothetical protein